MSATSRNVAAALALLVAGFFLAVALSDGSAAVRGCAPPTDGTERGDELIGTAAADRLRGLGSDDVISGRGGSDCLHGGEGDDVLNAGEGPDLVRGGKGDDRLHARDGDRDLVRCGPGDDRAFVDGRDLVRRSPPCEHVSIGRASPPDSRPREQQLPPAGDAGSPPAGGAGSPPGAGFGPAADADTSERSVRRDPMASPDPEPVWGTASVAADSRLQFFAEGGPGGGAFRRLIVEDGDDVMTTSGERAELGRNEWRYGTTDRDRRGTFTLYREGERKLTRISYRLPPSFPTATTRFNNIWQMKHANPSETGPGAGPLSLQVRSDEFRIYHNITAPEVIWSAPVVTGRWVDFAFDITYSRQPALGRVQVWADYGSGWVRYPAITDVQTLEVERSGAGDNPPRGSSVPAFLAAGIYHDDSLPGTHIDIGKVQVESLP